MTKIARVGLGVLVLSGSLFAPSSCGSGGGGGGGGGTSNEGAKLALVRIDQTLRRFEADTKSGAAGPVRLRAGLEARLLSAEANAIAKQAVESWDARAQMRAPELVPEFAALLDGLRDLPYLAELAATLDDPTGSASASAHATSTSVVSPPLHPAAATPSVCYAGEDCCAIDCGSRSLAALGFDAGLSAVGGLAEQAKWVENTGAGCKESLDTLRECAPSASCTKADLAGFFNECFGTLSSAAEKLGVETPSVLGLAGVTVAMTLAVVKADDSTFAECSSYQAEWCCTGKIKCGLGNCCDKGAACVGDQCMQNSTAGCPTGQATCGAHCCPTGWLCSSGVCKRPPLCPSSEKLCGLDCCTAQQACAVAGSALACSPCDSSLCGGTTCCGTGKFCNALDQCLDAPDTGCGEACGATCCAPGMSCASGACSGTPILCGDGQCAPTETSASCPKDCGAGCGNGICDPWETALGCPADCQPVCGNGTCEPGESSSSCAADCGSQSDAGFGGFGGFGGSGGSGGSGGTSGSGGAGGTGGGSGGAGGSGGTGGAGGSGGTSGAGGSGGTGTEPCCACTFDVYCTAFGPGGCWYCHNSVYVNGVCQAASGYLVSPGICSCDPAAYQVCQ